MCSRIKLKWEKDTLIKHIFPSFKCVFSIDKCAVSNSKIFSIDKDAVSHSKICVFCSSINVYSHSKICVFCPLINVSVLHLNMPSNRGLAQ